MTSKYIEFNTETGNAHGHGSRPMTISNESIDVVETTVEELSDIFSAEKEDGKDELPEEIPIEDAIADPLSYKDFLTLDDDEIAFDEDRVRPSSSSDEDDE